MCRRTSRTVVLKGYQKGLLKPRQLNNVRREIGLLKFFRDAGCKGVVLLLGAFEDKSMIYLVFEACMRGDLYQLLMRNRGTLHEEFVVTKVVFPLLCVLQQLHKLHVVHRDIKPENIFVTEDGEVALGDFGLAGHKFQDRMTERVGTLDYMAPEVLSIPAVDESHAQQQADGEGEGPSTPTDHDHAVRAYDEKVDIWATGVLVYELLVGRPPFEVDDPQETARLIMEGSASRYPVHISQLARDFIAQALTKSPSERPSADELLQHGWLRLHFGGKMPDTATAGGNAVSAGLLKSWLVASWSDIPKAGLLKPNSVLPNRLIMSPSSSPRKALSMGDDPSQLACLEDDVKPSLQYKRKSLPEGSDGGSDSPRDLRALGTLPAAPTEPGVVAELETQLSLSLAAAGASRDPMSSPNRLAVSQFPSRDSSAGSMDQAALPDRTFMRNDSGASASSSLSIASFASLQHAPRSSSLAEMCEADDLGMVQRSASVCASAMQRPAVVLPSSSSQLKPVWQSNQQMGSATASRKTPGKSRFAG